MHNRMIKVIAGIRRCVYDTCGSSLWCKGKKIYRYSDKILFWRCRTSKCTDRIYALGGASG